MNKEQTEESRDWTYLLSRLNPLKEGLVKYARVLVRRYRISEDAEDLYILLVLKLYRNLGIYDPTRLPFEAWAKMLLWQSAIDVQRKDRPTLSLNDRVDCGDRRDEFLDLVACEGGDSVENVLTSKVLVEGLISQLSPSWQCMLRLSADGHTYAEISGLTGHTVDSVRHNLFQARRCLKTLLKNALEE